ncbi:hypothetical protein [Leisingera thetidis]|uniref:hypothetical protein n=1 Tax=Leisingera thetidis TaxID=2930199 RepID=UPI0021F6D4EE|nr:hypothetical protein [Leisingera thetidis]
MLCFLQFGQINAEADYLLLSAMISNGTRLKDWLEEHTHGPVVAFDYEWKPTRQLRGCIVYSKTEYDALTAQVNDGDTQAPLAIPYGLFALDSNWLPEPTSSSALKALSDKSMPLAIGKSKKTTRRWLTSNRNKVAAEIAVKLEVHKHYEGIAKYIEHDPLDDWDAVRAKVTNAMSVSLFPELSEDDIKALDELINKKSDSD